MNEKRLRNTVEHDGCVGCKFEDLNASDSPCVSCIGTGGGPNVDDKYEPDEANPAVDHPAHYAGRNCMEAIDVIEAFDLDFSLGNAVKYILRAGRKDDIVQDLQKARWYIDHKIRKLEGQNRG